MVKKAEEAISRLRQKTDYTLERREIVVQQRVDDTIHHHDDDDDTLQNHGDNDDTLQYHNNDDDINHHHDDDDDDDNDDDDGVEEAEEVHDDKRHGNVEQFSVEEGNQALTITSFIKFVFCPIYQRNINHVEKVPGPVVILLCSLC